MVPRDCLCGHLADRHPGQPRRTRRHHPRPLGHRGPPALGPRHGLRRRPLPGPHRQRPTSHGHLAEPRHHHPATGRPCQHRCRHPPPRPPPGPATTNDHELLNDFAGPLPARGLRPIPRTSARLSALCPGLPRAELPASEPGTAAGNSAGPNEVARGPAVRSRSVTGAGRRPARFTPGIRLRRGAVTGGGSRAGRYAGPCGRRKPVTPMRPGNIHGPGRRAGPGAEPGRPAGGLCCSARCGRCAL